MSVQPIASSGIPAASEAQVHRTDWRAIWSLIRPYWFSEDRWAGRGILLAVIVLALGMVYLNVLFNDWNREFYNALENKDFVIFKQQLWRFSYLAFIYVGVAIYRVYLTQALQMRWRAWMTRQYLQTWLGNQAYYRIEQGRTADNPDQRIADDLQALTSGSLTLSLGLLSSVVTLVSFIGILWSISGPISFMLGAREVTIPGYMVWCAIDYAVLGSALTWWVGRPLVGQNFMQQRYEADFRFGLIRVRENAESIALYRGETQEDTQLQHRFEKVRANWWNIMRTTKRLNVASNFYSQAAIIFPLIVGAPRYFSGAITLGGLTQISSAFGQVQEALSWFVNAFSSLAEWKASVNRLAGFHAAVTAARNQPAGIALSKRDTPSIQLDHLVLRLPDGTQLNQPFSSCIAPGQRILLSGPSGCGKSTLFRAAAGIWPYGGGKITLGSKLKVLYLPQKNYLPIGTLVAAVAYPAAEGSYRAEQIEAYFEQCMLAHLVPLLDTVDNWSARLSPGEQQRLAFIRALLIQPDILFLDEASSALDAASEDLLYRLLLEQLPHAAIVSIAHREAVANYHQIRWQFIHENQGGSNIAESTLNPRYRIEQAA